MSGRGRGRGRGSDVRGPTSALTSFLREKGITAPQNDRFRARNDRQQEPPAAGDDEAEAPAEPEQPIAGPSRSAKRAVDTDSDEEEEVEEVKIVQKPKKKLSAAAMKKKQKKDAEQEEASSGLPDLPPKQRYEGRRPGAFVFCAECGSKFTYTKYTPTNAAGGVLCPPCQKEADLPPANAEVKPTAKRARAVKAKPVPLEKPKKVVKTLQNSCIQLIGQNIEGIEEFGDIGPANLDKICKIVCKNRSLDQGTIKLFLDITLTKLSLYDCAKLEEDDYELIANFAPHVQHLTLNFCGALKDQALTYFKDKMRKLTRIELYGSFLIKPATWISFFDSFMSSNRQPLEGFLLRQSPRFDTSCVIRLAENFPNLRELRLSEIQLLNDDMLKLLKGLKGLQYLDISHAGLAGQNLTDDGVVPLLEHIGGSLETLILNDNEYLGDRTLIEGIRINCHKLRNLGLRSIYELLPSGVIGLFQDWDENKGLDTLDISRCIELDDKAIEAIVKHSGGTLRDLNMNSVDRDVTEVGLRELLKCQELKMLDLGFVRSLDDFIMKEILEQCGTLQQISVFGCNRVTDHAPTRENVRIMGASQFKVEY